MSHAKNELSQPGAGKTAINVRSASLSLGRNPKLGRSLLKRRRWYADDVPSDDDPPGEHDDDEGGDDDASDDDKGDSQKIEDLPEWAQKIIKQTRGEAAEHRRKLREKEDADAKVERQRKEKQGDFQKLYEESQAEIERLKAYQVEVEKLREAQAAHNQSRLEDLPKATKKKISGIIEKTGIEDPYKLRDLLDELIPTLSETKPPGMDGGSRGDGKERGKEYVGSDKHLEAVANRYRLNKK